MKKIGLFTITIALAVVGWLPQSASAQMLIKNDGRVYVGGNTQWEDDANRVLSMSIQGTHSPYNAGSKLAFGDFGRYENMGWNVFVGEFGVDDSDKLWLHGKKGIVTTALYGYRILSIWNYGHTFWPHYTFYDEVRADRLAVSSDDDKKLEIEEISYALPRLLNLNGIKYLYKPINSSVPVGDVGEPTGQGEASPKEIADMEEYQLVQQNLECGNLRYGLYAGEMADMFPELVDVDSQGNQYVNYLELIPVMVSAFRELYEALEQNGISLGLLENYEGYMRTLQSDSSNASRPHSNRRSDNVNAIADSTVLYQNTPNPFTASTMVEYYIPTGATNAYLFVFNLIGELQQTYPINTMGHGSVQINGLGLNAGMYMYSLVVDGRVVDTKRMILTR